jgi:magnesium transporter
VEEFRDYLFVVVNPLAPALLAEMGTGALRGTTRTVTQLGAVITAQALITHHEEPLSSIRWLRDYLDRHDAQAERGPDYLFHLVLDETVDRYAPVLDRIDELLDEAEEEILGRATSPHLLSRLLGLKRRIIHLRKTLVHEREVLARLSRGEFELINDRETVYYRNVYDHLVRFTELIEGSRDMASDLAQTHLAAVSNRLNRIMKVLTTISTIVLPMSLVTGVYGMNFRHIPELTWPWGYPLALALMALVGIGSLLLFRWRRWI